MSKFSGGWLGVKAQRIVVTSKGMFVGQLGSLSGRVHIGAEHHVSPEGDRSVLPRLQERKKMKPFTSSQYNCTTIFRLRLVKESTNGGNLIQP